MRHAGGDFGSGGGGESGGGGGRGVGREAGRGSAGGGIETGAVIGGAAGGGVPGVRLGEFRLEEDWPAMGGALSARRASGRGEGAMNVKISIVTPSFNQARFLEETLRSVLRQRDQIHEYFVIDGGSDDGS